MVHCADNLIVLGRLAGQQTGFNRRLKAKVVYVRTAAVQWTYLTPCVFHAVKYNEFQSFVDENDFFTSAPPCPASLSVGPNQLSLHFALEINRLAREADRSPPSSFEG
jgi:hypothetical protein